MRRVTYLTLSLLLVFWITTGPSHSVRAESPAVTEVDGQVTVNEERLRSGDRVEEGDLISTDKGDSDYLDLKFRSGQDIRLKNGTLEIKSLGPGIKLELRNGMIFSAGPSVERSKNLIIETPTSVAGVRGTKFFLKAKPNKTYVCVCEGSVWVRKRGFTSFLWGEELVVPKGHDAHVYDDKALPDPQPNQRMVEWTWREFEDMGYKAPNKFRSN